MSTSMARQRILASGRRWWWRAAFAQSTIDHGEIR